MVAVAEREVKGRQDLLSSTRNLVFAATSLRGVQDLDGNTDFDAGPGSRGAINLPAEVGDLIAQQNTKDVQIHVKNQ
jgi:hypothetical protein